MKEGLRKVPNNGIDYLLYRNKQTNKNPHEGKSRIGFNYLGQFDTDVKGTRFVVADEPHGQAYSPNDLLEYDWDINGMVYGGQLEIALTYGIRQYRKETITAMMDNYKKSLLKVIDHCCNYGQVELTPSDMTYKELSLSQLEKLQSKIAK